MESNTTVEVYQTEETIKDEMTLSKKILNGKIDGVQCRRICSKE